MCPPLLPSKMEVGGEIKPTAKRKVFIKNGKCSKSRSREILRINYDQTVECTGCNWTISDYKFALKGLHGHLIEFRKSTKSRYGIPEFYSFLRSLQECLFSSVSYGRLLNAIMAKGNLIKVKRSS